MNKTASRLYVATPLAAGVMVEATRAQVNYLVNVLRLGDGDEILVFDGAHGEWRAALRSAGKKQCRFDVLEQTRPQSDGPDLHYVFAPVKRARLDFMVEKATELGVSEIRPVITRRTNAARVKLERMEANAIEAAEQCGVLRVPAIRQPEKLEAVLRDWPHDRRLIYCDENAPVSSPLDALRDCPAGPLAVLIGPEGGFEQEERTMLQKLPYVTPISLGPRVMRADTAALAALAIVNAVLGDWR
jgi:16S rRNA (uracil1498-N3)-methyltransferase